MVSRPGSSEPPAERSVQLSVTAAALLETGGKHRADRADRQRCGLRKVRALGHGPAECEVLGDETHVCEELKSKSKRSYVYRIKN